MASYPTSYRIHAALQFLLVTPTDSRPIPSNRDRPESCATSGHVARQGSSMRAFDTGFSQEICQRVGDILDRKAGID